MPLLDISVGEVEAAIEGREPTPAERNLTVARSRAAATIRISTATCASRSPSAGPSDRSAA